MAEIENREDLDNFLVHYGVKGMKWGVRRTRAERRAARAAPSETKVKGGPATRGSQDITVKTKAGKGVTGTKGGKRNVATDEAVKTKAARQKAKASTTDALSNKELKEAIERMNLEQQFVRLEKSSKKKRGGEFMEKLSSRFENQLIDDIIKKK